ncbi:hypothetical protein AYO21_02790 [Fonsecaea monophora]|uniref:Ketoreductase domain-containing protein n=1 Tax=Fonsecaea monophora TaxID=254056 RepID=A0A177FI87_9EURO|nr:hypothetical protein AYO21_02790 [Fonsecaea monophora]OAG42839.1 hypothetical protein AYO21_02790 [Fonsecaea monophora]
MPDKPQAPPTAYPASSLKEQDQEGGKGLDSKLAPNANWTQLEFWDDEGNAPYLRDYEGRGLLKDKAVIVTGGDSGIGRAVAVLMAREGADVTFVYLPEEEEDAQWTKNQIEKAGRQAQPLTLDVTSEENCKKIVEAHMNKFGKLSVLVNNSAMQEICNDIEDINLGVVEKTFRTNILSMFAMVKYALPHMKRGSSIVNSSSVAAYMGNPQLVDYSSTKGAITTFTRSLAQQLAPKGIRVNAVAPGIIWTPLQPATKGNPPEAMSALGVEEAPLQRPGMPVEMATAGETGGDGVDVGISTHSDDRISPHEYMPTLISSGKSDEHEFQHKASQKHLEEHGRVREDMWIQQSEVYDDIQRCRADSEASSRMNRTKKRDSTFERQQPRKLPFVLDQPQVGNKSGVESGHSSSITIASQEMERSRRTSNPESGDVSIFLEINTAVEIALQDDKGGYLHLDVEWTFFEFLEKQFGEADIKVASVVTLTGSVLYAQATTCGDYIRTTWPRNAIFLIGLLQDFWAKYRKRSEQSLNQFRGHLNSEHLEIKYRASSTVMELEATGDEETIRDLVQMLAWAGAAFGCSSPDENVDYCRAGILAFGSHVSIDFWKETLPKNAEACWLPLFSGVSIAYGFPIPRRRGEIGLEIPLQILTALLGAVRAVEYQGGVVIKGFSSMIVPTEKRIDIIQWHLLANTNCEERLSYRDGLLRCPKRALMDEVDLECLQKTRAVLGWCSATRCSLGSHDANYSSIDYSGAEEAGGSISFTGGSLGFQQFGVAQIDFKLGPKDGKCHFHRTGPYRSIVSAAEKTRVVLYDTSDQRGWLVPASEVILHMCQHRHRLEPFVVAGSSVLLPSPETTGQSVKEAKEVLLENESLTLTESSNEKYTLRDLVLNYWSLLEFLLDQNVRRDQAHGTSNHFSLQEVLQGYEYRSVVEERSPFRKKRTTLRRSCGGWPALIRDVDAVVLFASGFEDILRPLENDQLQDICVKWRSMPREMSYLATTVKILRDLYEVAGSRSTREYLTSTRLRWVQGKSSLFEPCTSPGASNCDCVRLQNVTRGFFTKRLLVPGPVIDEFDRGAVIFGRSSSASTKPRPKLDALETGGMNSQRNAIFALLGTTHPSRDVEHRCQGEPLPTFEP